MDKDIKEDKDIKKNKDIKENKKLLYSRPSVLYNKNLGGVRG